MEINAVYNKATKILNIPVVVKSITCGYKNTNFYMYDLTLDEARNAIRLFPSEDGVYSLEVIDQPQEKFGLDFPSNTDFGIELKEANNGFFVSEDDTPF